MQWCNSVFHFTNKDKVQFLPYTFAVSPESSVTVVPSTSNSHEGDTLVFSCSANGGPGNVYSWIRLSDSTTVGNTSNLTLTVSATDGGQYRCVVSNQAGNDSAATSLNGNNITYVYRGSSG